MKFRDVIIILTHQEAAVLLDMLPVWLAAADDVVDPESPFRLDIRYGPSTAKQVLLALYRDIQQTVGTVNND